MRASEAERETTVEDLRGHAAAGRLDLAELEERVETAFGARTREELAELTSDLPQPAQPSGDFDAHLRVFAAVQIGLVAIWALSGFGYLWPIWPFMGWGIGVLVHRMCDSGRDESWARGSKRALRRKDIASSSSC
jgi:hypothetical protein